MSNLPTFHSALLVSARLMSDQINTILEPFSLNYSLWQVLHTIHFKHSCTSIDIAEYLNISKPAVAKRIHILIELELLEQIDTEDKRQKMLTLSSKGLSLFEQCSSCIDQFEYSLIRHIEPEQLALVKATLELVLKQLQDSKRGAI